MSANNAVFVKQIDGTWHVRHGFITSGDPFDEEWHIEEADTYDSKADALLAAHEKVDELGVVEYGVRVISYDQ